jgi:hypothetical protein
MCKEVSEEELFLLEEIEDPNELRRLLEEIARCENCSCCKSSEPGDRDIRCLIHHQVRFRNRLFHIFTKMGFKDNPWRREGAPW